MFNMESILVNKEFVSRKDTYNLCLGGNGGFDHINDDKEKHSISCKAGGYACVNNGHLADITKKVHEKFKNDKIWAQTVYDKRGNTLKEKIKNGEIIPSFTGKKHKEKSKKDIGIKNSIHQKGEGNSQFGTMWITDGNKNKKIKSNENIPLGWIKGRKLKA